MMNTPRTLLLATTISLAGMASAQNIGINTTGAAPNASAMLDIVSTNRGLLMPRVALTARNAAGPITAPATSLVVYNTATASTGTNRVTPGFYYWDGSVWLRMFNGRDAWSTTGNYGTTVGTNYIGTNDAEDFVVKTGGTAAANERMRVLSGGQTVLNHATISVGDVFSVYGTGTTGAISGLGTYAINGYTATGIGVFGASSSTGTTGELTGVWGQAASTAGTGVVGSATATSGQADGVLGLAASSTGNGVYGVNSATTGNAIGVRGESTSRNGIAVLGIANTGNASIAAGTTAIGAQGQVNGTLAGTGAAVGLLGVTGSTMTTGDATGVWGQTASRGGTGVYGYATSTTAGGQPEGVYGRANNATGFGLIARNNNTSGTGIAVAGNGLGGNYLVTGSGLASTGNTTGLFSYYTSPGTGSGIIIQDAFTNQWDIGAYLGPPYTYYKIIGPGTVSTIVKDLDGERVTMYCPEAPEVLFQDYGVGQLSNGKAHIALDPILTKNIIVSEEHPLKVFVQLEGNCKGVYVTNKSASGFDVIELQGGTSDVPFSWSIAATRGDETFTGNGITRHATYTQRFGPAPPIKERKELLLPADAEGRSAVREAKPAPMTKTGREPAAPE